MSGGVPEPRPYESRTASRVRASGGLRIFLRLLRLFAAIPCLDLFCAVLRPTPQREPASNSFVSFQQ